MDIDTAKRACDLFIKNYDYNLGKGSVTFYGGEPLLNKKVLRFIVGYLNEAIRKGDLPSLNFYVITNGSLITRKDAAYFKKNNIQISISLDGPKEINDKMRINLSGSAFEAAIRGYRICREYGI